MSEIPTLPRILGTEAAGVNTDVEHLPESDIGCKELQRGGAGIKEPPAIACDRLASLSPVRGSGGDDQREVIGSRYGHRSPSLR